MPNAIDAVYATWKYSLDKENYLILIPTCCHKTIALD